MPTIREYVQSNIVETYRAMTDSGGIDGSGEKPDVVATSQARLFDKLFAVDVDEADLSEFVRGYLADIVTRMMIPVAMDYWQVQSRVAYSSPAGVGAEGGEQVTLYDKINGLEKVDSRLAERLAADRDEFLERASEWLRGPAKVSTVGPRVSTSRDDMVTPDPDLWEPLGTLLTGTPYGKTIIKLSPNT